MRTESGRLIQHEAGPLVPPEVMARRVSHVGTDNAMSAAGGRAPSTLAAWGIITRPQMAAAERYRRVYEWWRRTQGMPNRHGLPAYYPVASTPGEAKTREETRRAAEWALMSAEERGIAEQAEADDAATEWGAAFAAVSRISPTALVRAVVDMVCIEDVAPDTWSRAIVAPAALKALRDALDALTRHFAMQAEEEDVIG